MPLARRALRFLEDGQPRKLRRELTASQDELFVAALRDSQLNVVFAWDHERSGCFDQGRLF